MKQHGGLKFDDSTTTSGEQLGAKRRIAAGAEDRRSSKEKKLQPEPARLGSAQDVQVSPRDAFGVRSGWRAGPRGWLAPWAPRRFLRRFPFPKIAYPAYKSGRDGSPPDPSEGQVSICRGKLVVALERKKSLLLFSDVCSMGSVRVQQLHGDAISPVGSLACISVSEWEIRECLYNGTLSNSSSLKWAGLGGPGLDTKDIDDLEIGGMLIAFDWVHELEYVRDVGWDGALVNQSYQWVEKMVAFEPPMLQRQSTVRDGLLEAGITPYNSFTYGQRSGNNF
ncbi:GMC oxidoreductase [Musa troglodytarum]|uniref:GMC oxidoreductase n=1 Tax=Musa troglodytarum TaxID=320322 RepID=A0A9E7KY96_9LILI|nr:GMC oxidoreductase [Musa troglodytarum]